MDIEVVGGGYALSVGDRSRFRSFFPYYTAVRIFLLPERKLHRLWYLLYLLCHIQSMVLLSDEYTVGRYHSVIGLFVRRSAGPISVALPVMDYSSGGCTARLDAFSGECTRGSAGRLHLSIGDKHVRIAGVSAFSCVGVW